MSLTRTEIGSLFEALKRVRGRCLQRGEMLEKWLARNPTADRHEARMFACMAGRSPFPSIQGPRPRDPMRPFHDYRFDEEWSSDEP